MDVWPESAFQVSQELDDLFEAFNQPQVVPTSYTDSVTGDGSESGLSNPGHNPATFSLFTDLF